MIALIAVISGAIPAAASDYTLGIFGNANEDDTVNMQDVTYTELIILERRDRTELSDAKYDGKINMQDVTQIELVILGKEKELTLLDFTDRIVTVKKPVERVIVGDKNTTLVFIEYYWDRVVGRSDVELVEYLHGYYNLPVCCSGEDEYEVYSDPVSESEPDLLVVSSRAQEQLDGILDGIKYAIPDRDVSVLCLNFTFKVDEDAVIIGDKIPMKPVKNELLCYVMNDDMT